MEPINWFKAGFLFTLGAVCASMLLYAPFMALFAYLRFPF